MTVSIFLSKFAKRKYEKNYSEKKKTEHGEVRIYDEAHVKSRWKKKVNKLKTLTSDIGKLRKKVKEDLKSEDPKVRTLAAIVAVLDETAMRVGNDNSVDEFETFGATTLKKKHAHISGNKIRFKFKGKKSVDQDMEVSDPALVKAIKSLLSGKKGEDFIFEYEEGKRIRPKVVNRYLSGFGVTAKDLRGFGANFRMKDELKHTKDFEKALENVAEDIGHEAKTLENQYLDPALVKKYKKASLESATAVYEKVIHDILFPRGSVVRETSRARATDKDSKSTHRQTSPFGRRKDPFTGAESGHAGIDFSANTGDVVHAFDDGVVTRAGWQDKDNPKKGFGLRVYIEHADGLVSIYGHLSKIYVKEGQSVSKDTPIGEAGSTGRSTAHHLHFELHLDGKPVNPSEYLNGRSLL